MAGEALATIASVKGLVVALQAIRTNLKLPCAVIFDPAGLKLRFLDCAHAMQSGISLSASVSAGQGTERFIAKRCMHSGHALLHCKA